VKMNRKTHNKSLQLTPKVLSFSVSIVP
jgi:hypothetical protein